MDEQELVNNVDLIADDIERIADASEQLLNGRLTTTAIVILLHHKTRLPQSTIKTVLNALPDLKTYLRKDMKGVKNVGGAKKQTNRTR